jgi:antitoxin (DNA-binding transcriptional repressor) of toxin-antitoxin stability system
MTITVGAFEAKTKLSELLDRVENGEDVLITRRGKLVARLTLPEITAQDDAIDLARLRAISDQFVAQFGRPFKSTEIDDLLYDKDGLPK